MRVLHLITGLDRGGAETMLSRLVSAMDRTRFEPLVASLIPPGQVGAEIKAAGVEVTSLDMRLARPSPAGLIRLLGLLQRFRPHVVQTWMYHADLLGALATRFCPAGRRAGLVWNVRCSHVDFSRYRRLTAWTVRLCALASGLPDAVVVNSSAGEAVHRGLGYSPRRFLVIPNGFDLERLRPDPEGREGFRREAGAGDAPLIGMVARFDPMKDHETFFLAAAAVRRRLPEARFVLCGEGVEFGNPEIVRLLEASGLPREAVQLLGPRQDVARIMAGLDLLVSSSSGEGFPNVLGEAMACGVACAATDAGDSAAIIGDTGRIAPPKNPEALAGAALELLLLSSGERREMGRRARQRISERYSLQAVARQYGDLYESLGGKA